MANYPKVKIDAEKVKVFAKAKNKAVAHLSREMGHDTTWLSHVLQTGEMRKSDYILFNTLYGLDIKAEEPKEDKEEKPQEADNSDYLAKLDTLIEITTKILLECRAWNEPCK